MALRGRTGWLSVKRWGRGSQPTIYYASSHIITSSLSRERGRPSEVEHAVVLNSFTNLIHNDTAERIKSLPTKSGFQQTSSTCAQCAADDVGLQDDTCLYFLRVPPNLQVQQDTTSPLLAFLNHLRAISNCLDNSNCQTDLA